MDALRRRQQKGSGSGGHRRCARRAVGLCLVRPHPKRDRLMSLPYSLHPCLCWALPPLCCSQQAPEERDCRLPAGGHLCCLPADGDSIQIAPRGDRLVPTIGQPQQHVGKCQQCNMCSDSDSQHPHAKLPHKSHDLNWAALARSPFAALCTPQHLHPASFRGTQASAGSGSSGIVVLKRCRAGNCSGRPACRWGGSCRRHRLTE